MLFGIRTVQEFSYDSDIKMHNEMKKEGISTEEEYYKAHIDVNWISKDRLVSDLLKECKKMNTTNMFHHFPQPKKCLFQN